MGQAKDLEVGRSEAASLASSEELRLSIQDYFGRI